MRIYLTDTKQNVSFDLGESREDIQILLNLKKIIPSIIDLVLPILPDDNKNIHNVMWESTSDNFALFQKIYQSWGVVELRLKALQQYKSEAFVHQLLIDAQQYRKKIVQKYSHYRNVEIDYLFLLYLHTFIDGELVELGESFYVPTFKLMWDKEMKHLKHD